MGIVLVSHSEALALGLQELAAAMAPDATIAVAGGDDDGGLGTSLEKVLQALSDADDGEGAVVLVDLGSARLTSEMAIESLDPDQAARIVLSAAPMVEAAVTASTVASAGGSLAEVREALDGLGATLARDEHDQSQPDAPGDQVARDLRLDNPSGLHARPAAAVVRAVADLDATVTVAHGTRSASAASVLGLVALGATGGAQIQVQARGRDAGEAVRRIAVLVDDRFGEAPPGQELPPSGDLPGGEPTAGPHVSAGDVLQGVAASPGQAAGPLTRLRVAPLDLPDTAPGSPAEEANRLAAARATVAAELERLAAGTDGVLGAQRLLLDDPELDAAVRSGLRDGIPAERAWWDAVTAQQRRLADLADPVLAARAADVADVGRAVLRALLGVDEDVTAPAGAVVAADDIVPSQVAQLAAAGVAGLALARGGVQSHAAILARAAGLPAVVGLGEAVWDVADGELVLLDGGAGTVLVAPPARLVDSVAGQARDRRERRTRAQARAGEPALTRDGTRVHVLANVADAGEAGAAAAAGADGIGLLRTEFAFSGELAPDEDAQTAFVRDVCAAVAPRPVVVRTLDVGGDKPAPGLGVDLAHHGVLGLRGLRLTLARPEVFDPHLRAILRAADKHHVRLMFPFVTTVDELRAAKTALARARAALVAEGVAHGRPAAVGAMAEVPAAALAADRLAAEVDFFSIGSNDLVALTMAADRGDATVAHLHRPGDVAVLRLVQRVCAAGVDVAVCGEMATDPELVGVLVGLGVRELSVPAASVGMVKACVRELSVTGARATAEAALAAQG